MPKGRLLKEKGSLFDRNLKKNFFIKILFLSDGEIESVKISDRSVHSFLRNIAHRLLKYRFEKNGFNVLKAF